MNIFGGGGGRGYDEIVDIFRGPLQNRTILGGISKHSRAIFLRSRYGIGIFLGVANFQLFFGTFLGLIFLIFSG